MISLNGLTKLYGRVRAVDDLTFEVVAGKVTGFLGPNGAGKSTTMRMVMGLDRPTSGTVTGRSRKGRRPAHQGLLPRYAPTTGDGRGTPG